MALSPGYDHQDRARQEPAPGWTFFRQWLKNPIRVAAISPSSKQLARQMISAVAAALPSGDRTRRRHRRIYPGPARARHRTGRHAGAGTERGVAPAPGAHVSAASRSFAATPATCGKSPNATASPATRRVDAIISGLGLLSMPRPTQQAILSADLRLPAVGRPVHPVHLRPGQPGDARSDRFPRPGGSPRQLYLVERPARTSMSTTAHLRAIESPLHALSRSRRRNAGLRS